jgi:hypothetical protein
MPPHTTEQLREILASARSHIPEKEFCGIGVVLYLDYTGLPVLPLCYGQSIQKGGSLVERLIQASLYSNPCHDGFHLISSKLQLTHTNQYFAPPIPLNVSPYIRTTKNIGARYMTAQLGSLLPCVICTGIVSEKEGVVIFNKGMEVK